MPPLHLVARDGPVTCPWCRDELAGGPRCPACAVRYHAECAATFGRCATLGCAGALGAAGARGAPLPRLAALADRLAALRPGDPPPPTDARVLLLLPGQGEVPAAAAAAVGEALGLTPWEGRQRLGSSLPEPLVRVDGADAAAGLAGRLRAAGARCLVVPAAALLRPLEARQAHAADPAAARVDDGRGWGALPDPRLVVTGLRVEVTTREEVSPALEELDGVARPRAVQRRTTEPVALVLGRDDDAPLLLRRDALRIAGDEPTAHARWGRLLDAAREGADHVHLPTSASSLLSRRSIGPRGARDDLPAILLAARAAHLAWRAGALGAPKAAS
ncbi:MAG: hypothetical protein M9894_35430 [Planctomycetes bacterium]|nr:hypothetical protein [Planctomycetota bacterium]